MWIPTLFVYRNGSHIKFRVRTGLSRRKRKKSHHRNQPLLKISPHCSPPPKQHQQPWPTTERPWGAEVQPGRCVRRGSGRVESVTRRLHGLSPDCRFFSGLGCRNSRSVVTDLNVSVSVVKGNRKGIGSPRVDPVKKGTLYTGTALSKLTTVWPSPSWRVTVEHTSSVPSAIVARYVSCRGWCLRSGFAVIATTTLWGEIWKEMFSVLF